MIKEKTRYGLPLATIEQIHGVFRQFPKIERAVLFGSRAMRKGRHNSDVDLALYGEELTAQDAIDIAAALDDLPTPYKIDISCFATLTHGKLRDHIKRREVVFYERIGDGNPLPKGWRMVKLGDIATIIMGQAPARKDCNKEGKGVPFVKAGEFRAERPIIREWTLDTKKMGKRDDIFICVVGATCGKLNLGINCAIGRSVAAIRPKKILVCQKYIYLFLQTKVMDLRRGSLGSAQTVISREMIAKAEIPLPPLEEQERIVAKLDAISAEIERHRHATEQKIAHWHALKQATLTQALTPKKNWKTATLGEVCEMRVGKTPSRKNKTYWDESKKSKNIWVTISDMSAAKNQIVVDSKEYISDIGVSESRSKIVPSGTLLLSYKLSLGIVRFAGRDFYTNEAIAALSPKLPNETHKQYLYWYFHSLDWNLLAAGKDKVKGKTFNQKSLGRIPILLPPFDEQERIVTQMDAITSEINHAIQETEKSQLELENFKNSILNEAFKGNLLEAV